QDARLRLPAQPEQDEVVAREDRVDDLRHDGLLVADDALEERSPFTQPQDQVLAHLGLDGARLPAALLQFTEGLRSSVGMRSCHEVHRNRAGMKRRRARPSWSTLDLPATPSRALRITRWPCELTRARCRRAFSRR